MNTLLSQIFHYDFLTAEFVAVIRSTVSAASVAVSLDEVFATIHALPVNKMWSHEHSVTELLVYLVEILEEIEDKIVVTGVPDVVFNTIIGTSHLEFNNNGNLVLRLLITLLDKVDKLLSIFI